MVSGLREMVSGRKEMVSGRKEMVSVRKEKVFVRKEKVFVRKEMVFVRKEMVSGRKEMVSGRKEMVSGRKEKVSGRKEMVSGRKEKVGGLREKVSGCAGGGVGEVSPAGVMQGTTRQPYGPGQNPDGNAGRRKISPHARRESRDYRRLPAAEGDGGEVKESYVFCRRDGRVVPPGRPCLPWRSFRRNVPAVRPPPVISA